MAFLFVAFIASASVLLMSALFQISQRRARALRFKGLQLKPNVLLTRYPIAFLNGPRTVFRFLDHWNDIPVFLREHGYDVFMIEPNEVASITTRCHVVADGSLKAEIESLARLRLGNIVSLTLVTTAHREQNAHPSPSLSIEDLKPFASAVDIFMIPPPAEPMTTVSARFKLILLSSHNFLIKRRTLFVHPHETAETASPSNFKSEERFLDLAISLAERDLIGSD